MIEPINIVNVTINRRKVETINEQENPFFRKTQKKVKGVNYAENSNKMNNISKQILSNESEVQQLTKETYYLNQ